MVLAGKNNLACWRTTEDRWARADRAWQMVVGKNGVRSMYPLVDLKILYNLCQEFCPPNNNYTTSEPFESCCVFADRKLIYSICLKKYEIGL